MVDNNNLGACGSSHEEGGGITIKEQDRLLPIANVGRIMKQNLPPNAKISKEAKETMQECVSEFISFVTSEASEKCRKERRKTVNGDDICWALGTLGFDDYSGPLKRYLNRYREMEGERSNNNNNNQDGDGDGVGVGGVFRNTTTINEEMEDPYRTSSRTNYQQQQPRNQAAEASSTSVLRFMSNTSSTTSRPPY